MQNVIWTMGCVRVFSESPSAEWVIVGVMMCVWMGRSFTETPTKCSSPFSAVAHSNPTSSSKKEWVGPEWKGVGNSVSVKYHENRCVFELYTRKKGGAITEYDHCLFSLSYDVQSLQFQTEKRVAYKHRFLSDVVDDETDPNKTHRLALKKESAMSRNHSR